MSKKATRVPLQALIAGALERKRRAAAARGSALATVLVDALSHDPRVKDPVGRAHKLLNRRDRRALGDRGYRFGHGTLAASIRTRDAR